MKYLIIFSLAFLGLGTEQEKDVLKGKYRIEFNNGFQSLNSTIVVNDSLYSRTFPNGMHSKGTVKYWKYFVILKDHNSSQIMEFRRDEVKNDTISLGLKETDPRKSNTVSYLEVNIALGRLVRM